MTIHKQVLDRITKAKIFSFIFPEDFQDLKSSEAVRKALSRFTKLGILVRLARGIYLKPETPTVTGVLCPLEKIAQAIALRDKARIVPTGLFALYKLGFIKKEPMSIVFLTDGAPRKIAFGKNTITFNLTSPKNLATKGKISSLITQVLKEKGKDNLDPEFLKKVEFMLQKEEKANIIHDAQLTPVWVSRILLTRI